MDSLGIAQEQAQQWLHFIVSHVAQCKHTLLGVALYR